MPHMDPRLYYTLRVKLDISTLSFDYILTTYFVEFNDVFSIRKQEYCALPTMRINTGARCIKTNNAIVAACCGGYLDSAKIMRRTNQCRRLVAHNLSTLTWLAWLSEFQPQTIGSPDPAVSIGRPEQGCGTG